MRELFQQNKIICLILFVVCLFIYSRTLNLHGTEYRDDEIFYFKSTQQMIETSSWLSPKYFEENRFQKPILYYWFILLSYAIFGVNWFAARFVAAIFASLTIVITYLIAKDLFSKRVALLSSFILMTVPLFFRHAKNAVPDMPLNFFIVLALFFAIQLSKYPDREKYSIGFFISCALGFMVKGFAAWIVPIGTILIYCLATRRWDFLKQVKFLRGFGIMLAMILPWFIFMIVQHGWGYLEYMVVDETKNRLLSQSNDTNAIVQFFSMLFSHMWRYFLHILFFFGPWSFFFYLAIPYGIYKLCSENPDKRPMIWMLSWIGIVYGFFSCMYFVISHYMLVLSTPFAILTAYFLIHAITYERRALFVINKYLFIIITMFGFLVYCFIAIFLTGMNQWWLIPMAGGIIFAMYQLVKTRDSLIPPTICSFLIIFVLANSSVLIKAQLTPHGTLQKFAQTINLDDREDMVVGIGSHDIHEKEFQVFFDKKLVKAGHSHQDVTNQNLKDLFKNHRYVYCLINYEDYNNFLKDKTPGPLEIVQQEYNFRKRMYINTGFFKAIMVFDMDTVRDYLKEPILLVRQTHHDPKRRK